MTATALARDATRLVLHWQTRHVTRADWHAAEELIAEMALLDEARATQASETLAQMYEEWLACERVNTPSSQPELL